LLQKKELLSRADARPLGGRVALRLPGHDDFFILTIGL
jgi:hypothetical protein